MAAHVEELERVCAGLLEVSKCRDCPELVAEYSEPLRRLLEAVDSEQFKGSLEQGQKLVATALISAAAHVGNHYWTNTGNRETAQNVLNGLATLCGRGSYKGLLVGSGSEGRGVVKNVLTQLKLHLTRENWKSNPAHKQALIWCMRHLKHPDLSRHLDSFLPATLLLLDDHEDYHKILGLTTATHIVNNVDPTELRWYGRAEVLYEAVKPLLHWSNPEIIDSLHPCLLALLPVLDPLPKSSPAKPNNSTAVFDTLLTSLQTESKVMSRKALLSHVANYIELLGVYSVRHLKVMVPVLISCMEYPDYCGEYTRRYALSALGTLIKHAWPRIPSHKDSILKALLQIVADLCPSNNDVPSTEEVQSQLRLVIWCLQLLGAACPELKVTYSTLQDSSSHSGLQYCLQQV